MQEETYTPELIQKVPSLLTMDGRQYDLKVASKRTIIATTDLPPLISVIPGVVYGDPDGSIVPTDQEPFNIFLKPLNNIAPLKFTMNVIDAAGSVFGNISEVFYTWITAQPAPAVSNIVKTTQIQSKIQFLMQGNFGQVNSFPFDFKVIKDDFVPFQYPERIFFCTADVTAIQEYLAGVTDFYYNALPILVPGAQYFINISFEYLELQ